MPDYLITDFGAEPDVLSTAAIQKALDACASEGGGRVVVPAGATYLSGTLMIGAHTELHIEGGGCLKASAEPEHFTEKVFETGLEAGKTLWIGGKNAKGISLTGKGTIDGNSPAFVAEDMGTHIKPRSGRPAMTCFVGCDQMRIRDLTFVNSANWTLHFTGCEDILVDGVTILNDLKFPNCDGIDPDHCRNVRISNCYIEAADDCIVLKNTEPFAEWGPTENVTVMNCTMVSTSAAVKIGTESDDDFRNIVISNCTISGSNRALSIQLRDKGNIENVLMSNIVLETRRFGGPWWGCAEPIYITAVPRNAATKVGKIRNVRFSEIRGVAQNGIFIMATEPGGIKNLSCKGIDLELRQNSKWENDSYDIRPCSPETRPVDSEPVGKVTPWGCKVARPTVPVYLQNVADLRFDDVRIVSGKTPPAGMQGSVESHNVEDFTQSFVRIDTFGEEV